jgi:hypothetical protein
MEGWDAVREGGGGCECEYVCVKKEQIHAHTQSVVCRETLTWMT